MKQASIVEKANGGHQRGACENAHYLRQSGTMNREQNRQRYTGIDRETAEQWNRHGVDFARTGAIHHTDAQREVAHGNGREERRAKGDDKCEDGSEQQVPLRTHY